MASLRLKLNSLKVQNTKAPGLTADGGGLYLQVSRNGSKSWLFRFMLNGRSRSMGLGSVKTITLAEARSKSLDCRKLLIDGLDPIEERNRRNQQRALDTARKITFDECAALYIESHRAGWKNAKHADQWTNTLKTYVSPIVGSKSVDSIDTAAVMECLDKIWRTKTETASRVRSRIELVLDWASVHGYRSGDNPARWRGRLDKLLPKRSMVQPIKHHKALPLADLPEFMEDLRMRDGVSSLALEFTILNAVRTSEALNAKWDEISFEEEVWIIPPSRMKAKKEHRVPLGRRSLEILKKLKEIGSGEIYIFPSNKAGRPLSNMALLVLIGRMGYDVTTHGFRSTFRDWAGEFTNHPREVAEAALAHTLKDKAEAAYRRGDSLLKRRVLMKDWETFCMIKPGAKSTISYLEKNTF
ncbi:integrase arm-type DNA-binding domain-containing protein [Bdellovibrio sp. SKB1291214]|uniref:tyrosine-type recombinase/integrase n=1 Tax=Bdellovibrio sp. SKB1291214 TaxID=1732569 RepID=UPI000B514DAE|nr:site-specific integrase [Bdellovibrio sp. SKB1291214]UYL10286.1 integrase arm-type DNA-binding domain-containing protein [Bdellovibrio sp. SKB1291214]